MNKHMGDSRTRSDGWVQPERFNPSEGSGAGAWLRRKVLAYAQNTVGRVVLDNALLHFVLPRLSDAGTETLFSFVLSGFTDEAASGKANTVVADLDRGDTAVKARWILNTIETSVNGCTKEALEAHLQDLLAREAAACDAASPKLTGLMAVKGLYQLTDEDTELLVLALCYQRFNGLMRLCDSVRYPEKLRLLSIMTGVPEEPLRDSGGRDGRLTRCGIITQPDVSNPGDFYGVHCDIVQCLLGIGDEPFLDMFCRRVTGATYSVDSFGLPNRSVEILMALVRSGQACNILLHGAPGTGKTEFAKAIAMGCGKAACFVKTGTKGENDDRRAALVACANMFPATTTLVVVDEADHLLNTDYAYRGGSKTDALNKGWLNEFLETSQTQIVWITNDISCIEESTRRRFAYNVEFRQDSVRRRIQTWQIQLKDHPFRSVITPTMVGELSHQYRVNAASIAGALEAAKRVVQPDTVPAQVVKDVLCELLASHEKLTGHTRHGQLIPLADQYDPDAVNTNMKADAIINGLRGFVAQEDPAKRPPANMLFWGAPGTGKTAFAQHIARRLGQDLLIRRASDLLSMWVGGTEHNIRDAFEEAERESAILFLDEADSFFIDRQTARHSWETTQTNELLTQMENHHGILICCTNLLGDMDHAAMRRFSWKVKFLPLTVEGKVRLYRKYFLRPGDELPSDMQARITRIPDLTPGDIKAVWQRFRLQAETATDGWQIVGALEEEVAYKKRGNKVVGFR